MRFRDEIKRTYYSSEDKRVKAGTIKLIRYSDGRNYQSLSIHNKKSWSRLEKEVLGLTKANRYFLPETE